MEMISGFLSVSRSSPVITPQAEAVPRTSGTTTAHGECLLDFHDAPLTAFCQCVQKQQVPQSQPRTSVELFKVPSDQNIMETQDLYTVAFRTTFAALKQAAMQTITYCVMFHH